MSQTELVLGPLLRYVDETTATVWVETSTAATVTVTRGAETASARTFAAHGHHYALVDLTGLEPGSRMSYSVSVDGEVAWPPTDSSLPSTVISTLERGRPLSLVYGSCRTSVSHDEQGNSSHGVDALRTLALRLAGAVAPAPGEPDLDELTWPDLVLFLGDQVYADETTEEMREFIESRRDIEQPPGEELRDFEEYAHLYALAWSDPANRWLLSTVPSAMIFDDHDVRDDWNTSLAWRETMEATSWWHGRIVAALGSYWIYQHLGNLSPATRAQDPLWRSVLEHVGTEELDLSSALDDFADRVDKQPDLYRWSYERDFGTQARLLVVDSRAARVLEPAARAMLDPAEMEWLESRMGGDFDHLLIGTSVPFLLAPGLHHVEAFSEALAGGAWGRRAGHLGESLREAVDLEHWAAFQESFRRLAGATLAVARGERGRAPSTVTFLSGDVHHSYVSQARAARSGRNASVADAPLHSSIIQAVCSPIRNPLSRNMRFATAVLSYGVAGPIGRLVSWSSKVPDSPLRWKYVEGPWFDNNIAMVELDGPAMRMRWFGSKVVGDQHEAPRLFTVADHHHAVEGSRHPAGTGTPR